MTDELERLLNAREGVPPGDDEPEAAERGEMPAAPDDIEGEDDES